MKKDVQVYCLPNLRLSLKLLLKYLAWSLHWTLPTYLFIKLNTIGPFPQCAKSTLQIMQEKFINYGDDIGNLNAKILQVKIVTLSHSKEGFIH